MPILTIFENFIFLEKIMTTPAPLPEAFLPLESSQATLERVGGKGANLARLARAGFNVPTGFLIPTESYKNFVTEHKLDSVIREALNNLDFNDPAASKEHLNGFALNLSRFPFQKLCMTPSTSLTAGSVRHQSPSVHLPQQKTSPKCPSLVNRIPS
mgnify:CR=1 FL=1